MLDRRSPPDAERLCQTARGLLTVGGLAPEEAARVSAPLVAYATLLAEWGERLNLTGFRGAEAILVDLVIDAALVGRVLPFFTSLVDIGSGAGLPGIPLALLFPNRRFLLIEPRERRHHFLRHAIRTLEAKNVRTLRGRAEEQPPEAHDIAIAQAVGPPARVIPMLLRWVRPGGWIAIPTLTEGRVIDEPPAGLETRLEPYGAGQRHALWMARDPRPASC